VQGLVQNLLKHWVATGARPRPPAGPDAITSFALRNGTPLPQDLAAFYQASDGVDDDGNMFSVWPLAEIGTVPDRLSAFQGIPDYGRIAETLPDALQYLAFGDYTIWSHVLAVRANGGHRDSGPVIWICGSEYGVLHETFAGFWEKYLADPLKAVVI
jgi:hypothetical protein